MLFFANRHARVLALSLLVAGAAEAQQGPATEAPQPPLGAASSSLRGEMPEPGEARTYRSIPAGYAAADSASALAAIEEFLLDEGEDVATVNSLVVASEEVSEFSGKRIVRLGQQVAGLRVFGTEAKAVFGADGDLEFMTTNLAAAGGPVTPAIVPPRFALDAALAELHPGRGAGLTERGRSDGKTEYGGDNFFHSNPTVERVIVPGPGATLAEGFLVETWSGPDNQLNHSLIDGRGQRLAVMNLTHNDSYNVFLENPEVSAQTVLPGVAGWLGAGTQYETHITGNNAEVYLDRDDDDLVDTPSTVVATGDFLAAWDGAKHPTDPTSENDAVAIQTLFYLNNWIHDTLAAAGFTEAAGNFQMVNSGPLGLGGDPVHVHGQDGADLIAGEAAAGQLLHLNNANFATPIADGTAPRMQMYLWGAPNNPLPPTDVRDGALEADVVWHEYGHGLTVRIHGLNMLGTFGEALGEGASDTLSIIQYDQDTLAEWAYRNPFGIRTMPYDDYRNNTKWVWADDNGNGEYDPGVDTQAWPNGRLYDGNFGNTRILGIALPHFEGEIYAAIMWDLWTRYRDEDDASAVPADDSAARALLFAEWIEGMKLSSYTDPMALIGDDPQQWTYPDARDSLLYAISGDPDITAVPTDPAVRTRWCHAWNAFADLGVGLDENTEYWGFGNWLVTAGFQRPVECDAVLVDHVRPVADFSFSCTGRTCSFTDASTDADGSVVAWAWEFDDGSRSTEQNPVHLFPEDDGFGVVLRVWDDQGLTNMIQHDVIVTSAPNIPPVAAFTESCTDLTCDFTDQSTDADGSIDQWSWDFGNGFSSTLQNPSITYGAAGTYTVSLTVTDNQGAINTTSHDVTVTAAPNADPVAAFSYVCTGFECVFTDASTDSDGVIVFYGWDFGDGNGSTDQNPTYTYSAPGTYTVSLQVIDDDGATNTTTQSVTVPVVANAPPTAGFTYSCTDLDCGFTDTSSDSDGSVVSWSWDFGDGANSTLQNPSHSYAAGGTFTVSLTVTDDDGATDTTSQSVTVVANQPPTAGFTYSCTDLDCTFTDASGDSDGGVVSWSWDFGDGNGSSAQNPSHSYSAGGTFTVSLTVTDDDGATDTTSQSVTVTAPPAPVLHVGDLEGASSPAPKGRWNATATILVVDADGLAVAGATVDGAWSGGANGSSSCLTGAGGTCSVTKQNLKNNVPSVVFSVTAVTLAGATYDPGANTDADGDSDGTSITVFRDGAPANQPPTAGFTYSCTDLDCAFTDASSDSDGSVVSWSWDFGDGAGSSAQNPSHTYAGDGVYTVTLTVTDDGGATDSASETVTVGTPPADIVLSVSPYKVKGVQHVDLSWTTTPASTVTIRRNGVTIVASTANDGAYTDNIGAKGGGSYNYEVCENVAGGVCSNIATAVF